MKAEIRKQVYAKYNGHCAYCGKKIAYKDMQIDHIIPKLNGGTDDMSNLNPSCRLCNHYKRANSLTDWRYWELSGLTERLKRIYIFRVALAFGMIKINKWDNKFYFEKHEEKTLR